MKRFCLALSLVMCSLLVIGTQAQAYLVQYDFNTAWSGDYAPGWENTAYRHGAAPVAMMMQQVNVEGRDGVKVIVDSVADQTQFWAAVNPIDINDEYMQKAYNPWISVSYYHDTAAGVGQLNAVPSWVNQYIKGSEDWTDVQFGARKEAANDGLYYVAVGENHPGWQRVGTDALTTGWHDLKMQLMSDTGYINFYIDGIYAGKSYRNDYKDLVGVGLMTQFVTPLSSYPADGKPYAIFDDFQAGSDAAVPEPMSIMLGIMGLGSVAGFKRFRRK